MNVGSVAKLVVSLALVGLVAVIAQRVAASAGIF